MAPRHPQDVSDDAAQNETLRAVHDALNATDPAEAQPLAATEQETPPPQDAEEPAAADTQVEPDRTELYFRGPTAFTA